MRFGKLKLGFGGGASSGGGGSGSSTPGELFRATTSTAQAVTAGEREIDLGTEVFDRDGAFDANRYTVLSAHAGQYANFTAGFYPNQTSQRLLIQVSTDSGSNWTTIASDMANSAYMTASTGPVLLTAGHIYRVAATITASFTIPDDDATFFAAELLE